MHTAGLGFGADGYVRLPQVPVYRLKPHDSPLQICEGSGDITCILFELIISLLCLGMCFPYGWHIRRTGHNTQAHIWWELKTAHAAGTNGLTCVPKQGGVRDNT
jgi:hypothetical protein